ncbi:hypothetical protein B2J77_08995 [Pseudomonas parafulva]|uniref:Uncharacterized protein n=1 Tax=Pseudomonas parafulva TaxID=157782 RepID=A0AAC9QCX5_9PSED|nr:hypothetical protein B2J77_08995 [Pseudomonas parafulva]
MDYEKLLKISPSHVLVVRGSKIEQRKGLDTDVYIVDELAADRTVVASYEIRESMSIYPPFKRSTVWKRIDG